MNPTLALVALVATQAGAQGSGFILDDKPVGLVFPSSAAEVPSADVLSWGGWGYLKGSTARAWTPVRAAGDWSAIKAKADSLKDVPGVQWRVKFVLFTNVIQTGKTEDGLVRAQRMNLEKFEQREDLEAIQRFIALVSVGTEGAVKIVPELTLETDTLADSDLADPFGSAFVQKYLHPRINGGGYEAEDKVFRGPYHSVICMVPGAGPDIQRVHTVNGTPVSVVRSESTRFGRVPGVNETALFEAWMKTVRHHAVRNGFADVKAEPGAATPDAWSQLADLKEPATETLLSRLAAATPIRVAVDLSVPYSNSYKSPWAEMCLEQGFLRLTQRATTRDERLAFPIREDGAPLADVAKDGTFNVTLKSLVRDTFSFKFTDTSGKVAYVSFGRDPKPLVSPIADGPVVSVPFVPNSEWQSISVDLRGLGIANVAGITMEATPNARWVAREHSGFTDVFVQSISFTSEPATTPPLALGEPSFTSPEPEMRAIAAAKAEASSPELLALLKDQEYIVRLNAALAYTRIKDVAAEEILTGLSADLSAPVASAAQRALVYQGTENSLSALRRAVRVGLTPFARGAAALALGSTQNPKVGGDIIGLLANRSWSARMSAVEALAMLPNPEADVMRMAFLDQIDPAIKLAVTQTSKPADSSQMRKLMWSAVNEPSDAVRAWSGIKLVQSSDPQIRKEGYRLVRDDSTLVRQLLLGYLVANPDEAHRDALRLAVTDRSASVRSLALQGFAALEKGATTEEIANVMEDSHPDVLSALLDLAIKRGLKLPPSTIEVAKKSPSAVVRNKAASLGGS